MVTHEIPNVFHHSLDHGPILVVLQGILLIRTWHNGKNKHNLNFKKPYNVHIMGTHPFHNPTSKHKNWSLLWKLKILKTLSSHSSSQHPCFLSSTVVLPSLTSKQKISNATMHHTNFTHNKHHKKFSSVVDHKHQQVHNLQKNKPSQKQKPNLPHITLPIAITHQDFFVVLFSMFDVMVHPSRFTSLYLSQM